MEDDIFTLEHSWFSTTPPSALMYCGYHFLDSAQWQGVDHIGWYLICQTTGRGGSNQSALCRHAALGKRHEMCLTASAQLAIDVHTANPIRVELDVAGSSAGVSGRLCSIA